MSFCAKLVLSDAGDKVFVAIIEGTHDLDFLFNLLHRKADSCLVSPGLYGKLVASPDLGRRSEQAPDVKIVASEYVGELLEQTCLVLRVDHHRVELYVLLFDSRTLHFCST